ncbi:MAG: hypothetical protein KDA84_28310, partial [Planctomycetaceae bacterium]|nr:hypothetical protein [Planctomycetaceae bacterium]
LQRGLTELPAGEGGILESPNLDDRSWDDLRLEILDRLKKAEAQNPFTPWTDLSPADPGMALLETFAFLIEQLIYRLNRVPEKMYVELLKLLGVRRFPRRPATTNLVFETKPDANIQKALKLDAGTKVSTLPTDTTPPVTFETDVDVTLLPGNLKHIWVFDYLSPKEKHDNRPTSNEVTVEHEVTEKPDADSKPVEVRKKLGFRNVPLSQNLQDDDPAPVIVELKSNEFEETELWLGFDKPPCVPGEPVAEFRLTFHLQPQGSDQTEEGDDKRKILWWYWSGPENNNRTPLNKDEDQEKKKLVTDTTKNLSRSGTITFRIEGSMWKPTKHPDLKQDIYWLSATVPKTKPGMPNNSVKVAIEQILFNHVPATAARKHTIEAPISPQQLRTANEKTQRSFAVFQLPHAPIHVSENHPVELKLKRPTFSDDKRDVILFQSSSDQVGLPRLTTPDRNQQIDLTSGLVILSWKATGDETKDNIDLTGIFHYVAYGSDSNVPPRTLQQAEYQSGQASDAGQLIAGVTNLFRAVGGREEEPIKQAVARGRSEFRARDRAVTPEDFEYLLLSQ